MGVVDSLLAAGAAADRGEGLWWFGQGNRLGGYWEEHIGATLSAVLGAKLCRSLSLPYDILGDPCRCLKDQVKTVERPKRGIVSHEMGILVRSAKQLNRSLAAARKAGRRFGVLDEPVETTADRVSSSPRHLAKGLEFPAVSMMVCNGEVIPLQEQVESVSDDADLQKAYDSERHLAYVARTRTRERSMVAAVEPGLEFLDDLKPQ